MGKSLTKSIKVAPEDAKKFEYIRDVFRLTDSRIIKNLLHSNLTLDAFYTLAKDQQGKIIAEAKCNHLLI